MALLSSCWHIVEYFIIPHGFIKWYNLSFYIHPFFLFFCQIFLWLRWPTYIIFFLPYKFACYLYSRVVRIFIRRFIIIIRSYAGYRFRDTDVVHHVPEYKDIPQVIVRNDQNQIVDTYTTATSDAVFIVQSNYEVSASEISKIGFDQVHYESSEQLSGNVDVDEDSSSGEEEGISSCDGFSTSPSSVSPPRDIEMNLYIPSLSDCSSNSALEQELIDNTREVPDPDPEEEIDAFYKNYTERMRWFDLLNHDRAFALSTILSKQSSNDIISIESREAGDMSWAKMAKKRMVNSLENDFEMVYVAQSCLTWEALYYQHQKVESLIEYECSSSIPSGAFQYYNSSVAGKFQKFKILLERFMEDERFGGKRYWNYVEKRSSLKSLLQVPDISAGEEREGRKGEGIRATEMLKAIDKCTKTFWLFLQTEKRKQWWKANSLVWTRPPLEDPRDLNLLHDLIKTLHKKELQLKDLKGKKRCWWRRTVNPLEVTQKKEMLFTMIEMKLVSRVLSMSMVSTLQLKWCQEKLNHIDFKQGKIIRSSSIAPLFPSS